MEFIAVKKAENKLEHSAVILSQFAGCSNVLNGFLKINAFDVEETTKAFDTAINMTR